VVICLELGADLHMAQLMPLPLTVSCFSKLQISFTFLVPARLGSPGQWAVKRVCVCVCVRARALYGRSKNFVFFLCLALGRLWTFYPLPVPFSPHWFVFVLSSPLADAVISRVRHNLHCLYSLVIFTFSSMSAVCLLQAP